MKRYIILFLTAGVLLAGCDDQIMKWGQPDGENAVTTTDIPLAVKEVIANYDNIKNYAAKYSPNIIVGLGCDAELYTNNYEGVYQSLANDNFQMLTPGNAMKMDAIMKSSGALDFSTIDAMIDVMPNDMRLYGHNLIWYQQQQQTYLKSLIAPTMVVETDGDIANILNNGTFDKDLSSWNGWGNSSTHSWNANSGPDGSGCAELNNPSDASEYSAQFVQDLNAPLDIGKTYIFRLKIKGTVAGTIQFAVQNSSTYSGEGYNSFDVSTNWNTYEISYTCKLDGMNRICVNFGKNAGTYFIDDVQFGEKVTDKLDNTRSENVTRASGTRKSTSITYIPKTSEEKRTVLLNAMDNWIKGVAEHLSEKKIIPYGYDVINEPITDGTNKIRGVDEGAFGGSTTNDDGSVIYDSEPIESVKDGLNLNWGNNRFYWGYYLKDYAIQAFQKARRYLPDETKLFVNDYNLETSPSKLAALIKFVNQIDVDNGSPIVDGIGTQVHVDLSTANDDKAINDSLIATLKKKIDTMFKTLAATGKLIRVTELDIALGTSSPSSAQYECQAECYRMIFRSYLDNVPSAQQSGITIWTLSDNEKEHTYWLNGDVPNLFDNEYKRKWAYKGVCDGIANEDLGLKFGGDDYKAFYEKNNVSGTVSE